MEKQDLPPPEKITAAQVTPDKTRGESTRAESTASELTELEQLGQAIDESIETIRNYSTDSKQSSVSPNAYMMYSPPSSIELPKLRIQTWTCTGRPSPVSISKARQILATAYSKVPCELDGTGLHGYAWMVETEDEWKRRKGVEPIIETPTKPERVRSADMVERMEYNERMKDFREYNHMVLEGATQITEWFGESMFADLFLNGALPATTTPRELLDHLSATYATESDRRDCLVLVEKQLNVAYNHAKESIEEYFRKLQDAKDDAKLLGLPFNDELVMIKAMQQIVKNYGKDAHKATARWDAKEAHKRNWEGFKQFWKDEIHVLSKMVKSTRQANQAIESLSQRLEELETESRSYQEQSAYMAHALQAEQLRRSDDMSALTDYFDRRYANVPGLNTTATMSTPSTAPSATMGAPTGNALTPNQLSLLQIAKGRNPAQYKTKNDGRGKRFSRYCWRCGINTTHSTRGCFELTTEQKALYKDATGANTMGGSTKFLEREGKWMSDYNFDSL